MKENNKKIRSIENIFPGELLDPNKSIVFDFETQKILLEEVEDLLAKLENSKNKNTSNTLYTSEKYFSILNLSFFPLYLFKKIETFGFSLRKLNNNNPIPIVINHIQLETTKKNLEFEFYNFIFISLLYSELFIQLTEQIDRELSGKSEKILFKELTHSNILSIKTELQGLYSNINDLNYSLLFFKEKIISEFEKSKVNIFFLSNSSSTTKIEQQNSSYFANTEDNYDYFKNQINGKIISMESIITNPKVEPFRFVSGEDEISSYFNDIYNINSQKRKELENIKKILIKLKDSNNLVPLFLGIFHYIPVFLQPEEKIELLNVFINQLEIGFKNTSIIKYIEALNINIPKLDIIIIPFKKDSTIIEINIFDIYDKIHNYRKKIIKNDDYVNFFFFLLNTLNLIEDIQFVKN